jgi:hypothetical protein
MLFITHVDAVMIGDIYSSFIEMSTNLGDGICRPFPSGMLRRCTKMGFFIKSSLMERDCYTQTVQNTTCNECPQGVGTEELHDLRKR